jgi:hypothetical protein
LLHGLFASGRYWGTAYDTLADEACLAVPDLAGFGRSSEAARRGRGPTRAAPLADTRRDHRSAVLVLVGSLAGSAPFGAGSDADVERSSRRRRGAALGTPGCLEALLEATTRNPAMSICWLTSTKGWGLSLSPVCSAN